MATRQYVGARYVPKFYDNGSGSTQWSSSVSYEPLTIVTNAGNSYTSKKPVPVGIDISNTEYWVCTGNFNAQVEEYKNIAEKTANKVELLENYITPEMYGAVGDGVTNDTAAFNTMFSQNEKPVLLAKKYLITGNFNINWDKVYIFGDGEIILKNTSNTILFDIDDNIKYFSINDITINAKNDGGIIFNIHAETSVKPDGGVLKPYFNNIKINGRVDYVFNIYGDRQCDRILVINSSFEQFKNLYKSSNNQSVGNVFDTCSFFTSYTKAVYFEHTICTDCFTVINCSFSIYVNNQTIIKTTELGQDYTYTFKNNRFEYYTSTGDTVVMVDAQNGHFTFTNSVFYGLGNADPTVIFNFTQNSTAYIENCKFNKCTINVGESTGTVIPTVRRFIDLVGCAFQNAPSINYASTFTKKVKLNNCSLSGLFGVSYCPYKYNKYVIYGCERTQIPLLPFVNYETFPPMLYVEKIELYKPFATGGLTINYTINGEVHPITFNDSANDLQTIYLNKVITSFSSDNNIAAIHITMYSTPELENL